MSDSPQGPGWWQASDGKWYPPEQAPGGGASAGGAGGGGAAAFSVGDALSYGWNKFTQNVGPLIVATLFMLVIQWIVQGLGLAVDSLLLRLVLGLIAVVVSAVASFGLANIALKIIRGGTDCFTIALCTFNGDDEAHLTVRDLTAETIQRIVDSVYRQKRTRPS